VQRLREDDAIDELDLRCSGIGDTGATLLAFMLPAAMSVRSLNLSFNNIGPEGASALAAVLEETQIQQLECAAAPEQRLRRNDLTNEAKQALRDAAGSGVRIEF